MNNGLNITEHEFVELTAKQQNLILFKNLRKIRKEDKDSKFHRKVQYIWLLGLSGILGIKRMFGL